MKLKTSQRLRTRVPCPPHLLLHYLARNFEFLAKFVSPISQTAFFPASFRPVCCLQPETSPNETELSPSNNWPPVVSVFPGYLINRVCALFKHNPANRGYLQSIGGTQRNPITYVHQSLFVFPPMHL